MRLLFRAIFLILIFGFQACHNGLQDKLYKKIINDCPKKDTCFVSINSVTTFIWDTMYLFDPSEHLEKIDSILGFHYEYWEDLANRIIFTSKKKVVYHEDHFPIPSEPNNEKVFFIFDADSLHYMKVPNKDANFLALRKHYSRETYELKRIKSAPNEPAASMRGKSVRKGS
jgi:hypothetical protein